jgi:group I intron endonuclease
MGYIYKITNTINNKVYIGETTETTPEKRWNRHIQTLKYKDRGCPALKNAINEYGLENFKFEVIIICFDEDVYKYEEEYINKYNSIAPNGYNILSGGKCGGGFNGKKHTEDTINKIKESYKKFKEKNPNHFETYREKHKESMKKVDISYAMKNSAKFRKAVEERRVGNGINNIRTQSQKEEINKKISAGLVKYYSNYDRPELSETDRNKRRLQMTAKLGKKVIQYSSDGNIINEFNSISDAYRSTGVKIANIQQVLRNNTKTAGGFIWKYKV